MALVARRSSRRMRPHPSYRAMKYNLLEKCPLCLIYAVAKMDCTIALQRYQDSRPSTFGIKK